ncbi:MAG: protein kinase [Candidatus Melainabacteria bacterium]|nr:protein kinase [Candidatus Melainabacteria bacterium]
MPRVLVVEDNLDLTNVVRSLLEFENHSVDIFHTGTEGLAAILANPYDLVVLDWDLPGVSGLDILKQFRQSGAKTPVIMLTGRSTVEDMEAVLNEGADDYLAKPFNFKEFGARVRAHIRRAGSATGDSVSLGDIDIDLCNKRVSKGGRTYSLPEPEFQVLELAAKYPHIRPTIEDLLASIWIGDAEKSEPKLKMAIRKLRKKFDPKGKLVFSHLYPEVRTESTSPFSQDLVEADLDVDPYLGTIFNGKYELVELIGGGGSGLVYRAKQLSIGSSVALKVLHLRAMAQSDTVPRFQREARVTAMLSHPNIVAVRDFGVAEQGQPYLVMEFVDGASLAEYLKQYGRPPLREVIDIFTQACSGLEHAHQKEIVHRDIKPSNLMLIHNGDEGVIVKLVDFGLARSVNVSQADQITQIGDVLGSPAYMSPEQARGELLDRRTDIYSLGCALFETLQGNPPFNGKDSVDILVKQITTDAPEMTLDGLAPVLQVKLNNIVAKCLAKDKDHRYQSAAALKDALGQVMAGNSVAESLQADAQAESAKIDTWSGRRDELLSWFNHRFRH